MLVWDVVIHEMVYLVVMKWAMSMTIEEPCALAVMMNAMFWKNIVVHISGPVFINH